MYTYQSIHGVKEITAEELDSDWGSRSIKILISDKQGNVLEFGLHPEQGVDLKWPTPRYKCRVNQDKEAV